MLHSLARSMGCLMSLLAAHAALAADTAEVRLSRRPSSPQVARPVQDFKYDLRRTVLADRDDLYAPRPMSNVVGDRVAVVAGGGYCVYDIKQGRVIQYIGPLKTPLACVGLSADGQQAVTVDDKTGFHGDVVWPEERRVRVWDVASGKETASFAIDVYSRSAVRFAADGQVLLTGGSGGGLLTRWTQQGKKTSAPVPAKDWGTEHFFTDLSHDGSIEVRISGMPAAGPARVSVAQTASFQELGAGEMKLEFPFPLAVDASRDGRRIVFGEEMTAVERQIKDSGITVVDPVAGRLVCRFVSPDPLRGVLCDVPAVAISSDGRRALAATALGVHLLDVDRRVELCRFQTGPYARWRTPPATNLTPITAVALAADETKVLVYSQDGRLTVWEIPEGARAEKK